jgi:hypothetical protein
MTKVQMLDPVSSPLYEYDLKGASYVSGELFGLQAEGEAYLKQVGTWQFTFIGNRTDDNASFTATYSLVVAK